MKWYFVAIKKYAVFNGRARRSEFWDFTIVNLFFAVVALLIDRALGTTFELSFIKPTFGLFGFGVKTSTGGILWAVYSISTIVPSIAVLVRRLHDVGKSGWMVFVILIPLIGMIWLLDLLLKKGAPGTNEYGLNPYEKVVD